MKELVVCNTIKGYNNKIQEDQVQNYTTKLEIGCIALLWCSGSQDLKAKFMSNMANPRAEEFITHTGAELRFIFKKLLYCACSLPEKYSQHARASMEGVRAHRRRSRSTSSSGSEGGDDRAHAWDLSKVNDVKEMCEEEESYLNSFYRDCFAELVFPFGHSHMRAEKFIEVLSREAFSWVFDPEQLRGRFMNMARAPVSTHADRLSGGYNEPAEDLAHQVRQARHVVEQDKRVIPARRSDSDSDDGVERVSAVHGSVGSGQYPER